MANHDEVSATGPGGFGVALKAQNALILVILTAALAVMIYFQHLDRDKNVKLFEEKVAEFRETLKTMKLEHIALQERCAPAR